MAGDELIVVPVLAMLSSGVAAVALDPRNAASRLMLLAGVTGGAAYLVQPLAVHFPDPSVTGSLVRTAGELTFLVLSASLAVLMLIFPSGRVARGWHRHVGAVLLAGAVVAPLLQLIGARTVSADGDADTDLHNVLAQPALGVLGVLGTLWVDTEPLWVVLGLGVFAWRFLSADADGRRALRPLLITFGALGSLLVVIVLAGITGRSLPEPGFQVVFLVALSSIPLVLLAGLSERSRRLNAELVSSRGRLLSVEDDARRRLERDLHDGVQQQLVALLSLAELAARQARHGSPAVEGTLVDVRSQLTDAIEGLRELVNGFRPAALADGGVAAALESRMRRLPEEVTLDLAGARTRRWPPETEAAAFFVACEAVTNALKHAPGAPVRVRLLDDDGELRVEVADGGPGLAPGESKGSGLLGLRDRVDSLGGALTVGLAPEGGTLVTAVFGG